MAYVVSLQFSVPGTVALLGQVAPDEPGLWRVTFVIAALAGGQRTTGPDFASDISISQSSVRPPMGRDPDVYVLIAVVAAWEQLPDALDLRLTPLEIEGLLLTILVFLGTQVAWIVAMAPVDDAEASS